MQLKGVGFVMNSATDEGIQSEHVDQDKKSESTSRIRKIIALRTRLHANWK